MMSKPTRRRRRIAGRKKHLFLTCACMLASGACLALLSSGTVADYFGNGDDDSVLHSISRRLAGGGGGPCVKMMGEQPAGPVIGCFILCFWAFIGLAIVCDDYFAPSLEKISEVLNLSADVAGATFLAAGSSAPELFTSMADAFLTSNSIGMGTIVGSAMFNILVIVAASAAAAGGMLLIDWRPVCRDVCFYTGSILLLYFFFGDGKIEMWEALVMVLGYVLYIVFMKFNQRVFALCPSKEEQTNKVQPEEQAAAEAAAENLSAPVDKGDTGGTTDTGPSCNQTPAVGTMGSPVKGNNIIKLGRLQIANHKAESHSPLKKDGTPIELKEKLKKAGQAVIAANTFAKEGEVRKIREAEKSEPAASDSEDDDDNMWAWPDSFQDRFLFVWSFPFNICFYYTIPKCDEEKWESWYKTTFVMSILWIGALCMGMVVLATEIGCQLGASPVLMGLLVLSVGTSVPDAMGSIIAARSGEADMAIANAIGSNVFDVLLGLGLPWFLAIITGVSAVDPDSGNHIIAVKVKDAENGQDLMTSVLILLITVFIFVSMLFAFRWRMTKSLGMALLLLYVIFVVVSLVGASCKCLMLS